MRFGALFSVIPRDERTDEKDAAYLEAIDAIMGGPMPGETVDEAERSVRALLDAIGGHESYLRALYRGGE